MTIKDAIGYLQPVADSTPLAGYGAALRVAISAMQEIEGLRKELQDEKYRHDRYADFSRGQDEVIDRLKEELRAAQEGKHGDA